MSEKRIQFNQIVKNQLPAYVRENYPLILEFLEQYYVSQEFPGNSLDLIQNIDQYVKLDSISDLNEYVILKSDTSSTEKNISVDFLTTDTGTLSFPEKYGLILIDDEIITYESKTFGQFLNCYRGFSGIVSHKNGSFHNRFQSTDQLIFKDSIAKSHKSGSKVYNLSSLFLREFLQKTKNQLSFGFENRKFKEEIKESTFIKQIKNFYSSKGTDESFNILFKALYGETAKVIKPKENLFRSSDSQYQITDEYVVELISGPIEQIKNLTLFQNEYLDIPKAYASITDVREIFSSENNLYYLLKIDAGYNKDIRVSGATYGDFRVHTKTKVIGTYDSSSKTIDVDSTVGFPSSGEMIVRYQDGIAGSIKYGSKNLTQFIDCSGIDIGKVIEDGSIVSINTYAYATTPSGEEIRVRINSILSGLDIPDEVNFYSKDDTAKIKHLGFYSTDKVKDAKFNDFIFNTCVIFKVDSFSQIDAFNKIYSIKLNDSALNIKVGDSIEILGGYSSGISEVISVISDKEFHISNQELIQGINYRIKKLISKPNISNFPEANIFAANVQNIYVDKDNDKFLIASSSLPSYSRRPTFLDGRTLLFSGTFSGNTFEIKKIGDHGFYTGDCIYYTPEKIQVISFDVDGNEITEETVGSFLFDEGVYFVERVDANRIKFAKSKSELLNGNYVNMESPLPEIKNNKVELIEFKGKKLESQKLLREVSPAILEQENVAINPKQHIGMLVNGVEILSYKGKNKIIYGSIENVNVVSSGSDYDVLDPPEIQILDSQGSGAEGNCDVSGYLKEIRVIDNGSDVDPRTIKISITGGNGTGAVAQPNVKFIQNVRSFNSESTNNLLNFQNSTIGFSTNHGFSLQSVTYRTFGELNIGELTDNSVYWVNPISDTQLTLHKTSSDAYVGINTIQFTSYGKGNHSLSSTNGRYVLSSITVVNPGDGYKNRKREFSSAGISTSLDTFIIKDHGFESGELVRYDSSNQLGGLLSGFDYYVTKVDSDRFKLSAKDSYVTSEIPEDFYFKNKIYVNITSLNNNLHTFSDPPILANLSTTSRYRRYSFDLPITTIPTLPKIQAVFRGRITRFNLKSNGKSYGSETIFDFNRQPTFNIVQGTDSQFKVIVSNGVIKKVVILRSGKNYNTSPDLKISGQGNGTGAVLTPVVENGEIVEILVIEGGSNYSQTTKVTAVNPGFGAAFSAKIKEWQINLVEKNFNNITEDDGYLSEGLNSSFGLQYTHLYAPRKLRQILYSKDQTGKILYYSPDLKISNNIEVASNDHSPIIGWAYDGNPIYGPYGYSKKSGGAVSQMKSGYILQILESRPSLNYFAEGFFIEDYAYIASNDETVLDENNGRFCVTPEFPNGTYAYFATVSPNSVESVGPFKGFKKPEFPYLIGKSYHSKPNKFNFDSESNQDSIDLNETKWYRNVYPLSLNNENSEYPYFTIKKFEETIDVVGVSPGSIEKIDVISGGDRYRVNDNLIFNNIDYAGKVRGYSLSASVSELVGKQISSVSFASTSIQNVPIYSTSNKNEYLILNDNPHEFKQFDLVTISGLTTDTKNIINTSHIISVPSNNLRLVGIGTSTIGISSSVVTGIVTYIKVNGNLNFFNIMENDVFSIIGIATTSYEKIKVLNVDLLSSRLRILRQVDNTLGYAHSIDSLLIENSRKILLKVDPYKKENRIDASENIIDREFYFDPKETLALGLVGIGTTIKFSNPGVGATSVFAPLRSVYLPNHKLRTGDILTYNSNGGTPITIRSSNSNTNTLLQNNANLYVAKINDNFIGISTNKVGLGSTGFIGINTSNNLMYFIGVGTGVYHSFKTNYSLLKSNVTRNTVKVSTAETHGLLVNDQIKINVIPENVSVIIKYDDYNRRILVNPRTYAASDVNTIKSSIRIKDHGFVTGQKVIHTTTSGTPTLPNETIYYVIYVDKDNIKFSETYFNAINENPSPKNFGSPSTGIISPINPPIRAFYGGKITFDLSDLSLTYSYNLKNFAAFNFSIFQDKNFKNIFDSSEYDKNFNVTKVGTIGNPGASLILEIDEKTPNILYYNLIPLGNEKQNLIPKEKLEYSIDRDIVSHNEIHIKNSVYSGNHKVSEVSNNSFNYFITEQPEASSYISTETTLKYSTSSKTAFGPINDVKITNKGREYYSLPVVSEITGNGKNAVLECRSKSIGKIKKIKVVDRGIDFPTEKSLTPYFALPKTIKIDNLYSLEYVGIISQGRGYVTAPKLIVLDGRTRTPFLEADLSYKIGDREAAIRVNAKGLSEVTPIIIPTQNSNGITIVDIQYNSSNKEVSVFLPYQFSSEQEFTTAVSNSSFPFKVNDRIFIENISVGVSTVGKGFNSSNYNYQTFTIKEIDENIGGQASIKYSLSDYLSGSESPGIMDKVNSSGKVIFERNFPIFDPKIKKDSYRKGETVKTNKNLFGVVEEWDSISNYLKISTNDDFSEGDIIEGLSSRTIGTSQNIFGYFAYGTLGAKNKSIDGWKTNAGFLNDDLQRISDNFYYQNFSYSIKSKVPFDTWNDSVSSLNHPVGYRKFADLQVESTIDDPVRAGILTDSILDLSIDLTSISDLNCTYDFDLARENNLQIHTKDSYYGISNEIYFDSRILTDYNESIGNRVLLIDDISDEFNSGERPTPYVDLYTFDSRTFKTLKFISYIRDKKTEFANQRQLLISTLVHNGSFGVLNQYGRVETLDDLGSFDFIISNPYGIIRFFPTKYSINDYDVSLFSYNISDISTGIGTTSLASSSVYIEENNTISDSSSINIVNLPISYSSAKILVQINREPLNYQLNEINLIHDGTSVSTTDYGQMNTSSREAQSIAGYGTYHAYISGNFVKLDFIPTNVSIGNSFNITTVNVALGDTTSSGIGTFDLNHAIATVKTTEILSSASPTATTILSLPSDQDAAYCLVQVSDITNNKNEFSEVCLVVDDKSSQPYLTEFGNVQTDSSLGSISASLSGIGSITNLQFTPLPNIKTQVKVYANVFRSTGFENVDVGIGTLTSSSKMSTYYDIYKGTETDKRRDFSLTYGNYPIFQRYFESDKPSIVDLQRNMIFIPSHFFVTGEKVIYNHTERDPSNQPIGIAQTNISGIGVTDKLPSTLYIVKINENRVRVAASASEALLPRPKTLDLTSLGTGFHKFTSTNQNSRVIIAIDNLIQSPLVSTAQTSAVIKDIILTDEIVELSDTYSLYGGDLIKINDEVLRVQSIRPGNKVSVRRSWMGTKLANHGSGTLVTKVLGTYNIVDSTISFSESPYGNEPQMFETNPPDEQDWVGISSGSSFSGRCFLRSGVPNSTYDTYGKNYIFDDISEQFNGKTSTFPLRSLGQNITGISEEGALILINDVPQSRGNNYAQNSNFNITLSESNGITSVTFVDFSSPSPTDISYSNLPKGGIIVSVGSTEGLGYQPLISAGATSIVSISGTIQTISIGNTGSGYRAKSNYEILSSVSNIIGIGSTSIFIDNKNSIFGIINLLKNGSNCRVSIGTFIKSTNVISVGASFINIGIGSTSSHQIPPQTPISITISNPIIGIINVEIENLLNGEDDRTHVGFSTIINGSISESVSITTSVYVGVTSYSPKVFIESPQSYYNIPLIYTSSSPAGVGTGASIDIVVGQGSSVIDFELNNKGYGYNAGEVLTIPVGSLVGIPTSNNFNEFKLFVDEVFDDSLTGWAFGELEILDDITNLFDGVRRSFPLTYFGELYPIKARRGSNIKVQDLLLVFINDVLQVPGEGYIFKGGTRVIFTEPPKGIDPDEADANDRCKILFYKGTKGVDVVYKNILETVKSGDLLTLGYDPSIGQSFGLQEEDRVTINVDATDIATTNPYPGPGISINELSSRPIVWCRQKEDKIIGTSFVTKDRMLYEAAINPNSYVIKPIGIGETIIYVDNIRPFFNQINETNYPSNSSDSYINSRLEFQRKVTILQQSNLSPAFATAVVSSSGTISSLILSNEGFGYYENPIVSIGFGGSNVNTNATATSTTGGGAVLSLSITNPGSGYTSTNPPQVLISQPVPTIETNEVSRYFGDSGIIVGFGTTSEFGYDKLIFDFFIPQNSQLRDENIIGLYSTITGLGKTDISGISTGDYFIISDSIVGVATTSFRSLDSTFNVVGLVTSYVDGIYQVDSFNNITSNVLGVGNTIVKRVFAKVSGVGTVNFSSTLINADNTLFTMDDVDTVGSGYTGYIRTFSSGISSMPFGNFSWGKLILSSRSEDNYFDVNNKNGISGITTSSIVIRTNPLKYRNYYIST